MSNVDKFDDDVNDNNAYDDSDIKLDNNNEERDDRKHDYYNTSDNEFA